MTGRGTIVADQRRQIRRTALGLALLALVLYAAFILFALRHGHA
jgi:hypothetical protein